MPQLLLLAACIATAVCQSAIPAQEGLPHPPGMRGLDCCLRALALEFGVDRVSRAGAAARVDRTAAAAAAERSMRDALRLGGCTAAELSACPKAAPKATKDARVPPAQAGRSPATDTHQRGRNAEVGGTARARPEPERVYVSPTGSDGASGTAFGPLRTLAAARDLLRRKRGPVHRGVVRAPGEVWLAAGTYRLTESLELTNDDGGDGDGGGSSDGDAASTVTWAALPGHDVAIKGSVDLAGLRWEPAPRSSGASEGTLMARVDSLATVNSLYQRGNRLTRARFPDVDGPPDTPSAQCTQAPEVFSAEGCCDVACGMAGTGLPPFNAKGWLPNAPRYKPAWAASSTPLPSQNATLPVRGWGADPFRKSPSAFNITAPYRPPVPGLPGMVGVGESGAMDRVSGLGWDPADFTPRWWRNASTAVVHMQHGFFWGSWQFRVRSRNDTANELDFWYGGYQAGGWATGGPWFVENVIEELTAPGEWFFDESDRTLYLRPNGSTPAAAAAAAAAAPGTDGLEAVTLKTLLSVRGDGAGRPVRRLAFRGLRFEQTATTFLEPYVMPSGGDYRVFAGGAVTVENADSVTFESNTFADLGGNGLFLSGGVKNSRVALNEFVRVGDSAVLSAGSVSATSDADGSFDTVPSGNAFVQNHVHRIGMYGKQSAGFFQSVSCGNRYEDNVIYDGPRHGFSWNDHYGGGTIVARNLVFNQMKESRVGGPFNDWDRSAYFQRDGCVAGGGVTVLPEYNVISRNFFLNGYGGHANLDHDDGGWRFVDEYNLCVYGTIENHDGTDKLYRGNLVVFPGVANHSQYGKPCFEDTPDFSPVNARLRANNTISGSTCYVSSPVAVLLNLCNVTAGLGGTVSVRSSNATYVTPGGGFAVHCGCAPTPGSKKTCTGSNPAVGSTNLSLADLGAHGLDAGSRVRALPPPTELLDEVLAAARALLAPPGGRSIAQG